jgi:hypothetical protein
MKTYLYKQGYTFTAFVREHTWSGAAAEFAGPERGTLLRGAWKAFRAGHDWITDFERGGPDGNDIVITAAVESEGIHHRVLVRRADLEAMLALLDEEADAPGQAAS